MKLLPLLPLLVAISLVSDGGTASAYPNPKHRPPSREEPLRCDFPPTHGGPVLHIYGNNGHVGDVNLQSQEARNPFTAVVCQVKTDSTPVVYCVGNLPCGDYPVGSRTLSAVGTKRLVLDKAGKAEVFKSRGVAFYRDRHWFCCAYGLYPRQSRQSDGFWIFNMDLHSSASDIVYFAVDLY